LLFLGNRSGINLVDDTSAAITAALDQVGPRLKQLRTQRRTTLTELAKTTGVSKSTLSRLETGQRRPTLELLLALSQAYRVPLDDLVGAPDVSDPRIRLKPGRVKGRTVIPLTRQPDGMQAWKIVIPTSKVDPNRARTTATNGSTFCPATCVWFSATRTAWSGPARSPNSTPRCRTGSAAQGTSPWRSSASSPGRANG
jgi:transcriptional regulator with XRE-family HTH domain